MTTSMEKTNPEIDQDRAFDLLDTFDKYGCVMFDKQRLMYFHLQRAVAGSTVLEAGCGNGVGTAMLSRVATNIIGTDKSERNVTFAAALYPWLEFATWDINEPASRRADVVVCVETIEHVAHPKEAIGHLIAAAQRALWISTPNGTGKPRPPENPYHVREYTPREMLDMIGGHRVTIRDGEKWQRVGQDTLADPLVYEIEV